MHNDIILKAENISKQYRLGVIGTGTISHDLNRWWHKVRGKEDPYLKVGETNDRAVKSESEFVWALKDINFEVERGEVLGIIGKNGAGKSTLLKILSRVTGPTTGVIKSKGRIASLLEVGTGFHPELTGRENIFLNGAILGMTKAEIRSKLDEIVDFSGVVRYVDTPVKRYSSGMRVRLAFAVAAFLEPDILVVDEVLAVGDAEFQKKAIGKMQDISKGEGRTVLFVSHNMGSVKALCSRGIILEDGMIKYQGNIENCIDMYLNEDGNRLQSHYINKNPKKELDILEIKVLKNGKLTSNFNFHENIAFSFKIKYVTNLKGVFIGFNLLDLKGRKVFSEEYEVAMIEELKNKIVEYRVELPSSIIAPNSYKLNVGLYRPNVEMFRFLENSVRFDIEETGTGLQHYIGQDLGCVVLKCNWDMVLNG